MSPLPNLVRFDDGRLLTRNLAPGQRVYDEELHTVGGAEHRTWNPMRSKLGSYLVKGGRHLELRANSRVLYLGAANGTTPSHVSDIVADGLMVAVEFSPRSFRDLLRVADKRPNMVPVLADAWRPELYDRYIGQLDLLFQDIAQRQQGAIFAKNVNRFKPRLAILAVKARSVNVAAHPRDVYEAIGTEVADLTGYQLIESVDLGPFEKDHAALVFVPGGPKRAEAPKAARRESPQEQAPPPKRPWQDRPPQRGGWQERGPARGGGGGGWGGKQPYEKRDRPAGFSKERRGPPPPRDGGDDRRKWR